MFSIARSPPLRSFCLGKGRSARRAQEVACNAKLRAAGPPEPVRIMLPHGTTFKGKGAENWQDFCVTCPDSDRNLECRFNREDDTCIPYLISFADLMRFLSEARHKRKTLTQSCLGDTRYALKF